jgi:hypothetical protein
MELRGKVKEDEKKLTSIFYEMMEAASRGSRVARRSSAIMLRVDFLKGATSKCCFQTRDYNKEFCLRSSNLSTVSFVCDAFARAACVSRSKDFPPGNREISPRKIEEK